MSKAFVKAGEIPHAVFINSKHIAGTRVATELLMGDGDGDPAYSNPTIYFNLIGWILTGRTDILRCRANRWDDSFQYARLKANQIFNIFVLDL